MSENHTLLIKCFGKWWQHSQHHYPNPPRVPDDIVAVAEIIIEMPNGRVIKNRFGEPVSDVTLMQIWISKPLPDIDELAFRKAYVDYIESLTNAMNRR